jgi:PAS domain S-box-containing protein
MLGVISIFNLEGIFKDSSSSFLEKEQRRLTELYSLNLIGTPEEKSFDQITNLASRLFGVPISLITLITEDKQWFKSCVGLPDNLKESRSTERSAAFCHCVVADGNPLVVQDSTMDERFINNRFVKEYNIRFYAGAPIITKHNNVLGSLCIIDTKPRLFSEEELNTLIDLSNWVKAEIELKADLIERTISEQSIRTLYEVTSNKELSFQDKLRNLLTLGCKRFKFPYGVVSRIKKDQFEVLEAIGESGDFLKIGDLLPLSDMCSSNVAASLEPVHIKDSSNQYSINGLEIDEYIGAPIFVNNQFYGTFCFVSGSHDVRTINFSDLEFLQLMAQWIGNEIERLQSDEKLKESQERLQQIANNIKEAFWMFDIKEQKPLYMSSAWFDLTGITIEEFNQTSTYWLNVIHPDDLEYVVNSFKNIKESGEVVYRLFHTDGTMRWIRNRIVPVFNKEGIIYRIVGVAEDITDSKINEELLRKSDKLAAIGQLAASIAHEIRNPLTSIKGFMQLINYEQCSFKDILLSEFNQIENFINEILLLANPHHETTYEKKHIDKLLQEVVNTIKGQANLHDIQFSFKMNEESLFILCDENQIKQVFQNIIENAVEAMPDGGLVSVEIGTEMKQFVYVLVEDQGIGITKDRLTKLGEPFYSNKEKGSGLGLMISYKIIQNHKGRIEFTSQLNKGTKVKVLLPMEC